ncbi:transmembrane protease serine 9-like [Cylas formicarius]|uniref:transmembrane protease serine 9-like n=1 Tax=Cylas formicarius TaxID=197179 RepID=UPI002958AA31|nr:transmembrane protease serine 9-like [Cylas formicarius]
MAVALIISVTCLTATLVQGVPHGSKPAPRIVGGQDADIQDYPYQAAVLLDGEYACQASIISTSWVIGVSHCFYDTDGTRLQGNWSVRVGSSQPSSGGQIVPLSEVNFYDPYEKFLNDLALLKLDNPLEYGPSIQAVKLPEKDRELKSDEPAVATGWGSTADYSFQLADQLQQVTFNIVLTEDCQSSYGNDLVSDTMFCAQSAGKGLCSDDGGAPLVSNGTLLGVGEFSLACGQVVGLPGGAFANVALYRDWIGSVKCPSGSLGSGRELFTPIRPNMIRIGLHLRQVSKAYINHVPDIFLILLLHYSTMRTALTVLVVCLATSQIHGVPLGSKPAPRIVGGADADIQYYPYLAAVLLDGEYACQASIIDNSWIITAGHCFYDNDGHRLRGQWSARVGSSQPTSGGEVVPVSEVHIFRPYQMFSNDLALLKLEIPLEYGSFIHSVKLPENDQELISNEPAAAIGWGSTSEYDTELSDQLQYVKLNIVLTEDCKKSVGKAIISDTMFCAQSAEGGKGLCSHDTGAPLVADGTLLGVGEFSVECGNVIGLPGGVFTNVALYRDWIARVSGL